MPPTLCHGLLAVTLAIVTPAPPLAAQEAVGRAVVDGQPVLLYSDNTWAVEEASTMQGCSMAAPPILFCGSTDRWRPTTVLNNPDITAQYQLTDRFFGLLIVEALGAQDGLTVEDVQGGAIMIAAGAAGVAPEQIPMLAEYSSVIDGQTHETIAYGATINGFNVVYTNTLFVRDRDTVQAITLDLATEFTTEHSERHAEFLSLLRVSP